MSNLALQAPAGAGELQDSIAEFVALAEIHFAEVQVQLDDGNLDSAIEQSRFAETNLATARALMLEARELEAMVRGS